LIRLLGQVACASLLGTCLLGSGRPPKRPPPAMPTTEPTEEKVGESGRDFLYKIINFALLAGGLGYVLRKPATEFFRSRSASIQKSLEEGRNAEEKSKAQLQAIKEKLTHLEEEIAAFQAAAQREMQAEREHLGQATAAEAARILDAAREQIEVGLRGAKSELKNYAARQAVTWAEGIIRDRLDEAGRQRLVKQFAATLEVNKRRN